MHTHYTLTYTCIQFLMIFIRKLDFISVGVLLVWISCSPCNARCLQKPEGTRYSLGLDLKTVMSLHRVGI